MTLLIADVSEFQPDIDWDAYAASNPAAIVRVHNGWRADNQWPRNQIGVVRCRWWGAYQYLPASVDPARAALAMLATLGDSRPSVTILDLEEGGGDQQPRQDAWLRVMAGDPADDWTYSGLYFARQHNVHVDWIAAYGQREPTVDHLLWQFSDSTDFPGVGTTDASVFNGSIDDLLALTTHNTTPQEINMAAPIVELKTGEIFVLPRNGEKPWHVPNPAVLAALQFAGLVEQPNPIPVITNQAQIDGFKSL